ncbi:MAG: LacI family transcriptional regulator [Chloroflexi bacterium]|nr:MAG: LacI family transcriptional regulator [Chloroflexota bacterium]
MDKTDDTDHRKPVTMRKVAETAGVSMATVSRVLNGSGPVNAQAAERVRAAIASLKYQPNRAARTLASSRSAFIGLLIADIQNPFFIELMCGIEEEVRQNRYLLIMCSNPLDPRTEEQRQYIEILAAAPVAGAIILPIQERMNDQPIRDPSIDSVRIDNITAAKETVAHLIANGYRRIGVISGPKSTSTANERVLGYRQALQEAGIKHDPVLEHRGPFTEETGQKATHSLLDLDPPVDAIFGTNNRLTIGALRTLYVRRKRVPDDIALVGFDMRGWANPDLLSITTVLQPAYELGRAAANRLIQRIRQPDAPKQEIILPYQLLIGESSHSRRQPGLIDGHWNAGGMLK